MNKVDYVYYRKMDEILKDTSKFRKVNCDSNITNLTKLQRFLYYLKTKQNLNDEVCARVRPSAAVMTLYGIPKLHKPGIPCKLILAFTGNFMHDCAVWLNKVLPPICEHSTNPLA